MSNQHLIHLLWTEVFPNIFGDFLSKLLAGKKTICFYSPMVEELYDVFAIFVFLFEKSLDGSELLVGLDFEKGLVCVGEAEVFLDVVWF